MSFNTCFHCGPRDTERDTEGGHCQEVCHPQWFFNVPLSKLVRQHCHLYGHASHERYTVSISNKPLLQRGSNPGCRWQAHALPAMLLDLWRYNAVHKAQIPVLAPSSLVTRCVFTSGAYSHLRTSWPRAGMSKWSTVPQKLCDTCEYTQGSGRNHTCGKVKGQIKPTGHRSKFKDRLSLK